MLFNSYTYLLLFLPLVALGFHLLRNSKLRLALGWLVVTSLVFYGVWNPDPTQPWSPKYVLMILASCTFNYFLGKRLSALKHSRPGKLLLGFGVGANLLALGYFKYAGFLAGISQDLMGWPAVVPQIVLPLAISFFTFLQIAYLVDAWRGETEEYHFTDYLLFVTFFPHLIAGPLIHHREMMPQFARNKNRGLRSNDMSVGITLLALGLFKKVVVADYLARTASPIFDLAAGEGRDPTMAEAWAGALSYSLQLYFDFSGYSDMALGSARIFGIRFPLNFHSPYKATSIVDFWRRWHITLSRFLRDYLYIPLGGNRKGPSRRYVNLFVTMLLGGLWHGAGWTFIVWGALHGALLCLNHAWFGLRKKLSIGAIPKPLAIGMTFFAIMIGWVFFRAHDFHSAKTMLAAMFGFEGWSAWPPDSMMVVKEDRAWKPIIGGLLLCWFFPNTQQFMKRYLPALGMKEFKDLRPGPHRWWHWRPTIPWAIFTLAILYGVGREFDKVSEFIYFQF
ncbi:MBOAT family protein [Luteolibacter sp. GHJ8]|uniref:MBOAT family protein n=1 Tax=Luteolibacter rhizosphaerae TaxID=2989719 RepID=A0ABT3G7I8_9BACT|nr:MBOAT family protein [Luteolibacter rhizosphaerae]MCW1915813.1 MBOAT family protein [Luteolibacter rhizosphaerae]